MSSRKAIKHGSSTRLMILVLFLIVVGIGCIFEFTYARPQFQEAWEKIKTVDSSANSGEFTSDMVERLFGGATVEEVLATPNGKDGDEKITPKKPSRIDENMHDDCVVRTYRWRSGLLVKSHDIHVVFTKLKKGIEKKNPKLKGRVYYFSAAAGQPLDPIENFPLEKESIVINLNPPQLMGGGIPGGDSGRPQRGEGKKKGSDKKGDESSEENKDEKKGEKKEASEKDEAPADQKDEASNEQKDEASEEKSETSDKTDSKTDDKSEKEADDPNKEKESDVEKSETKESSEADANKEADDSKESEETGEKGEGETDKKDG